MSDSLKKLALALLMFFGGAALAAHAATPAKPAPRPAVAKDWSKAVTFVPSGAVLRGNPAAKTKLVEYISYSCPHCAHFDGEASPVIDASYVKSGKVQVELRPFVRNMFDVTASLLAHCGGPERFFGNHAALLAAQGSWLKGASGADDKTIQRWNNPDFATRMRLIAGDLGLTALMQKRGYTQAQLNTCLADRAMAQKFVDLTNSGVTDHNLEGTPSFLINDELQAGVYDWQSLRPLLDKSIG
jgi:protein-disulfide isomerase